MNIKPLIIANWKLGLDYKESAALANEIKNSQQSFIDVADIVLCPSPTSLEYIVNLFGGSPIKAGAQNIHSKAKGSFTGAVSISAVEQIGCQYVIVGHSELRKYFHETNADVAKKVELTIGHGLIPIICIGETYDERQSQRAELVVRQQLKDALSRVKPTDNHSIVIAYEPIWAIGTGQAINPDQGKLMGLVIHQMLIDMFPQEMLHNFTVVYGGSIDASNVSSFIDGRVIKGVLVGGSSQRFDDFHSLVLALSKK